MIFEILVCIRSLKSEVMILMLGIDVQIKVHYAQIGIAMTACACVMDQETEIAKQPNF